MRNLGPILIGLVVILFGLSLLLSAVFDIDLGDVFCAGVLILIGVVLLIRALTAAPRTGVGLRFFGPVRRDGAWQVAEEEIWLFLGDVRLDFTQAEIPTGETPIRVFAFLGNLRAIVPEGVGVSVVSTALISDVRIPDQKREGFLVPVTLATDGFEAADRRLRLEATYLISNVRVRRA